MREGLARRFRSGVTVQIIVTSYQRPKYLKPCIESLRQDDVRIYVVDGGSDQETCNWIKKRVDGFKFLNGNPGADVLKNVGIKSFVEDPEFMLTSDDLLYPEGYSRILTENYHQINQGKRPPAWTFCACPRGVMLDSKRFKFEVRHGVSILPVSYCQVRGAIIDTEVCRQVGYFPVYGRSGQGDCAFSSRLRRAGFKMGYFKLPVVDHLGRHKERDYPDYSKVFAADSDRWHDVAKRDNG